MPDQRKVSISDLKDRYDKLSEIYSTSELINDLYQRRYLHGPADRICQKYDFNVVVFGHTHNALIDKDFFLVEDRIYANTGSWCKKKAYCVEIDKSPDSSNSIIVYLYKIDKQGEIIGTKHREL